MNNRDRFSPVWPAFAALAFSSAATILIGLGHRGKFTPPGPILPFIDALKVFAAMCLVTFVIFYILRLLGVRFRWLGEPETEHTSRKRGKRMNQKGRKS
ncbi:MAG: hypothetical protein HZA93_21870 [Verrucomicrobia bacterium]|nr:hypothetical protein [Verrucomicrobiota bacterium]